MTSDAERISALFDGDHPTVTPAGYRHVLRLAPPMPEQFWGSVTYEYQAGEVRRARVEELLKP